MTFEAGTSGHEITIKGVTGIQVTVNSITGTLTVEEHFYTGFGGNVAKRPKYVAVLAHGKYKTGVGNYSSKALVAKCAVADAEAFLRKIYPVVVAVPVAVPAPVQVHSGEFDLCSFLTSVR